MYIRGRLVRQMGLWRPSTVLGSPLIIGRAWEPWPAPAGLLHAAAALALVVLQTRVSYPFEAAPCAGWQAEALRSGGTSGKCEATGSVGTREAERSLTSCFLSNQLRNER